MVNGPEGNRTPVRKAIHVKPFMLILIIYSISTNQAISR